MVRHERVVRADLQIHRQLTADRATSPRGTWVSVRATKHALPLPPSSIRDIRLEILALLDAEREEHAHHLEVLALRRLLVQHAAGRVSYRLTPWVPNNQNAEVSHNAIRMANSTPPAMGSAQPG